MKGKKKGRKMGNILKYFIGKGGGVSGEATNAG
jgi:hypothetical protein